VAFAGALIARFLAPPHPEDFDKVEYQLYRALNAPAFLLSQVPVVLLCFVWLVWYAVGIEISGRGQSVLTPKTRSRRAADALAMIFGAGVGMNAHYNIVPTAAWLLYPTWGVTIIGFYGHDLWVSFRSSRIPDGS